MEAEYQWYVGIDWATAAHQACVLDAQRQVQWEGSFTHSGDAIAAFAQRLHELGVGPEQIAVAIEIPRGAVVETLVEQGFHVYAINPKQVDRFRDRYSVAGAKDDRLDALVLGDSLRTDRHCYRRVRLDDPLVIQLREVSRVDQELGAEFNQLSNRLREQLHRFYAQALTLCSAADEPWLWALLALAPSPAAARGLRKARVQRLLREHRVRRLTAEEVLSTLKAPALQVAPGVVEAATEHIALLLARLRLVHSQQRHCEQRLDALMEQLGAAATDHPDQREHRDVEILRSLPGVGRVVAATVLAEASGALAERDYHGLRAHAGIAPVTKQSGKQRVVAMRHACNQRLRNALYYWAKVAAVCDPPSKAYYAAVRKRGHSYARALRSLGDRLLRILVAMLKNGTLYTLSKTSFSSTPQPAETRS